MSSSLPFCLEQNYYQCYMRSVLALYCYDLENLQDSATWLADLFRCCMDFLINNVFRIPNPNFPHQYLLPDSLAVLSLLLPRSVHLVCLTALKVAVGSYCFVSCLPHEIS